MSTSHEEPAVIDGQLDIYDQLNDEAAKSPMPALNADQEAVPIWQNYCYGLEEGDPEAVRIAREDAEAWARDNQPAAPE